jgi:hypothetical protein
MRDSLQIRVQYNMLTMLRARVQRAICLLDVNVCAFRNVLYAPVVTLSLNMIPICQLSLEPLAICLLDVNVCALHSQYVYFMRPLSLSL